MDTISSVTFFLLFYLHKMQAYHQKYIFTYYLLTAFILVRTAFLELIYLSEDSKTINCQLAKITSYGSNSFLAMIKFIIVISFNGVVLKVWYPNVHFGTKIEKNAGGGLEVLYISSVTGSWRSPVSRCSRKGGKIPKTFWSFYFWKINQQLKIEETMP